MTLIKERAGNGIRTRDPELGKFVPTHAYSNINSPDSLAFYPYIEPVEPASLIEHEILACYITPKKIIVWKGI